MRTWLVNLRVRASLNQENVAQHINKSRQLISAIENGSATPSVDTAKKIADLFGFDWTLFFENDNSR